MPGRKRNMQLQQLLSYTRRAVSDYGMIKDGDRIAVGISGGKDSLTLLHALSGLRRFYPEKFELLAVTVNLGYPLELSGVRKLCEELSVPFYEVSTNIREIVFDIRKEPNPCSLCAKLRKGAFNDRIKELGCNKLAYAHHKDDVIETMLMSLMYEGRFHCFSPVTYLSRAELTLIRPLIYVPEPDIIGFAKAYELPIFKNPCPADGYTKREYTKELIRDLMKENPLLKEHLFDAVKDGTLPDWKLPDK